MCDCCAATGWIILLAMGAQTPPRAPARASAELIAKFRAEASRLRDSHVSEFFEGLIRSDRPDDRAGGGARTAAPGDPSDPLPRDTGEFKKGVGAPVRLIEDADRAARDALRFWLERALAHPSEPPTWDEWQRVKALVVGHAEAIVREGVLSGEQARRWRGRASSPRIPQLTGRYSTIPKTLGMSWQPNDHTRWEYFVCIDQVQYEWRSSDFFTVLIGGLPPDYRNFIGEKADPSGLRRLPGLSPEQVRLLEELDLLARKVRRYWWMRDVVRPPGPDEPDPKGIRDLPPTPAMELRLSDRGLRVRTSIAVHAEDIALTAILTPELAEPAKRQFWRERDVFALLDPELAARLRLTRGQREELAEALPTRRMVLEKTDFGLIDYSDGRSRGARGMPVSEYKRRVAALDQTIWEILNPSQLRALARLLDQPVAGYSPPRPGGKTNKAGPES